MTYTLDLFGAASKYLHLHQSPLSHLHSSDQLPTSLDRVLVARTNRIYPPSSFESGSGYPQSARSNRTQLPSNFESITHKFWTRFWLPSKCLHQSHLATFKLRIRLWLPAKCSHQSHLATFKLRIRLWLPSKCSHQSHLATFKL